MYRTQHSIFSTILTITCLAMLSLFVGPSAAHASESADADPAPEEEPTPALDSTDQANLENLTRHLRGEARSLADHSAASDPLEADEVLRQIRGANSPRNIFDWIRENIEFEPYGSSLRGAGGALVSRSANAVDQALLAKEVLEAAGHEVRFATGRLHQDDAEQLLDKTLGPPSVLIEPDASAQSVAERSVTGRSSTLRIIQDHVWLKVGDGDDARSFDPVASPTFGVTVATEATTYDELPEEYHTDFEMTLRSELDDGQTMDHLVVDGPLSRVAFQALTLSFEDDPTRARGHRPILSAGGETVRGTTIPVGALERLELRFRFKSRHHENRWNQTLYHQGQGVDIFDFDHQHFAVAVAPGWTSETKLRHMAGQSAQGAVDAIDAWLKAEAEEALSDEERQKHITALFDHLGAALPFAFARTLDRTSDQASERLGVKPILGRPRVLSTGLLRRGEEFHVDLQVDGDRMEALPLLGIPSLATKAFVGIHGLIRDHLVSEMLESYGDHQVTTVRRIFREAARQSVQFTTVGAHNFDRIDRVELDDSTRPIVEHQIRDRSMTVLTPVRPVESDGVERFGWWAVNPFDGNLEGHTADAIVAVGDEDQDSTEDGSVEIARLIRVHINMVARHFAAASHAVGSDQRFPEMACSAARQFDQISRGFCATTGPMPRADLASCLAAPPRPEGDLLNLAPDDCGDQFAPFRCAAAYASALLQGQLLVVPEDDPSRSSARPPLCE